MSSNEDIAVTEWKEGLLKAIKERNTNRVKLLIEDPPRDTRTEKLLNEPLTKAPPGAWEARANTSRCRFRFTLPIILAAIHGEVEILDILFTKGADLYATDRKGEGVVHALCWAAGYRPECEASLCPVYRRIIELAETTENKRKLLHAVDKDGLRPLELAASFGNFMLMNEIFDTIGIYKHIVFECPVGQTVEYDFSEYECGWQKRRSYTPINCLPRLVEGDLEKRGAIEILESPVLKEWVRRKFRKCLPIFIVECLVSVQILFGMTIMDDYGHAESCPRRNVTYLNIPLSTKYVISYITMAVNQIYTCLCFFFMCRGMWKLNHLKGFNRLQNRPADIQAKGNRLVTKFLFTGLYAFRTLLLFVYLIVDIAWPGWRESEIGSTAMLSLRVGIQIHLWWGMFYYIQLLPGIGHLVIAAFRCLGVFVNFLLILFVFFIASAEGMRSVAMYYCLEKIGYTYDCYYSTFLIMLNMINTRDHANQSTPVAIILMHLQIVFVMVILLLNFLIALLSGEVGKIEGSKHVIQTITKCNVCYEYEGLIYGVNDLLPKGLNGNCGKNEKFLIEVEEYSV